MDTHVAIIICAWGLDALIGDPERFPHPVRLIGALIGYAEAGARRHFSNLGAAGIIVGAGIPLSVFAVTWAIVGAAALVHPLAGSTVSMIMIYFCMSTRCLGREGMQVMHTLSESGLDDARSRLARIVGRDTRTLDRDQVVRATVETISENTVDGIISPLLFAFLGGAPLAMAYKAVNTLDSMVGYKNERYRDFGRFSARLDDAANYIPARLCIILVPTAALLLFPAHAYRALLTGLRDSSKTPSPNAGFPEACFAGALGIELGGPCIYQGVTFDKARLGNPLRTNEPKDIARSVSLMWLVSIISLILFTCFHIATHKGFT
ncbi:MAG: cobalamin biosynthesis protein CobD [Deltaproteobacteria bacterium]|nr:cobalamin biosynthesis protein CobD [Deltaproteobacteria bacterium]